jgi:hypothetical protein
MGLRRSCERKRVDVLAPAPGFRRTRAKVNDLAGGQQDAARGGEGSCFRRRIAHGRERA